MVLQPRRPTHKNSDDFLAVKWLTLRKNIHQYVLHEDKSKAIPLRHVGAKGERKYRCYSFFTSALDEDEWLWSRPCHALSQGKKTRYPMDRRLGGPQELVWTQRLEEKSFASDGDETPLVQCVVRHYTD
jgi:hypothetical protein